MPRRNYKPRSAIRVIGPSIAYIPLSNGDLVTIDSEDASHLEKFWWRIGAIDLRYAYRYFVHPDGSKSAISMHVDLMPPEEGKPYVDHINRNGLHNWKGNLRRVTPSENQWNGGLSKNSKSGHRGVNWMESRGRWAARIKAYRKQYFLGYFASKEEAVAARIEGEKTYQTSHHALRLKYDAKRKP